MTNVRTTDRGLDPASDGKGASLPPDDVQSCAREPHRAAGRIDTEVARLARAGAGLHDGRERTREMAENADLRLELKVLAEDNPDGDGPFRRRVGADLLPAAPASERAEAIVLEPKAPVSLAAPHPPVPPGAGPLPQPEPPPAAAAPHLAKPDPWAGTEGTWPPFGEPGVRRDTLLEANARLRIPRSAFEESRGGVARIAEAWHRRRRVQIVGGAAVLGFATLAVLFGMGVVGGETAASAVGSASAAAVVTRAAAVVPTPQPTELRLPSAEPAASASVAPSLEPPPPQVPSAAASVPSAAAKPATGGGPKPKAPPVAAAPPRSAETSAPAAPPPSAPASLTPGPLGSDIKKF